MLVWLLGLFIIVPIVELALLLYIAQHTSWLFALGLVIVTGVAGGVLARHEGVAVVRRIQDDLAAGHMPTQSLVEGVLVLVGGVLLITPGVITDLCGLVLLAPWTRVALGRTIRRRIRRRFEARGIVGEDKPDDDDWLPA